MFRHNDLPFTSNVKYEEVLFIKKKRVQQFLNLSLFNN
jgi:hypothetical protein